VKRHLLTLLAVAALAAQAGATTLLVDQSGSGDHTTIGAAVAAATTGDTVLVAAGTYQGAGNTNIDLGGKNLVIRSQSGAAQTIIDCQRIGPNTRAFYLHSGEDTTCVIEDLTVLRGYAISGAAIWCSGASPKIVSCRFDSCGVAYGTVRLDNSNARIVDCAFRQCSVFVMGGAIFAANSSPVIRSTTIDSCSSGFLGGGFFHYEGGSSTLTDVTITGCTAGDGGAGAFIQDAPPTLNRVHFVENVADTTHGGGMYINCDGVLNECTFTGNYAGQEGGGVYCWGAYLDINDCSFSTNDASAGGGLYGEDAILDVDGGSFYDNLSGMGGGLCAQGGFMTVTDAAFNMNTAASYGGGLASLDVDATIDHCTMIGNNAWSGAGIYCDGPSDPEIDHCTLSGNTADAGGNCALLFEGCDPTVANTIVAFTVGGTGMGCEFGASPNTSHSCFYANDDGDGLCGSYTDNIFDDPLFCDGPTTDLGLHDDSPCLPAGNAWGEQIGAEGTGGCGSASGVAQIGPALALAPANPNPTSTASLIQWTAPARAAVDVSIYDVAGRLVREAEAPTGADGHGSFEWDGHDTAGHRVSSGVYMVRVATGGHEAGGRLVLLR